MQSKDRNFLRIRSFCLKRVVVFAFLVISTLPVLSQPGGDGEVDPDLIPIDGGLGFLLAAGVGYGIKKARDYKKIR